ncbi:hypothetical protein [Halomontanus rarus]|uniref:hypothetical protein n=1 Tax=Halomontanus rarus TaxID=3034020 RepID=UPI00293C089B|nr:hypothetical protein [Halovivax sp. KZCA124]
MLENLAAIADWIQNWAQTIGTFGSLFLSAALVILYVQQKNLLEANYDATHKAVVEVEVHRIDDDRLILQLSNVGNAVGTDLELVTVTVFEETEDFAPAATTTQVRLTNDEITRGRQSIKSHEDNVAFGARPSLGLKYSDGETHRVGNGSAMEELERAEIEVLRVHWFLRYQDLRGEYDEQYVAGIEVDVDQDIRSFESLSEFGAPMFWGGPTIDAETLEMDLSEATTGSQRTIK